MKNELIFVTRHIKMEKLLEYAAWGIIASTIKFLLDVAYDQDIWVENAVNSETIKEEEVIDETT